MSNEYNEDWLEDTNNILRCEKFNPKKLNQCYGVNAKCCPRCDIEDEPDHNELCRHCYIVNSRGYCEITHPKHPEN